MTEQTITLDEKERDAIDIFLFSNGEKHSPPRKYHLNMDELKTWDGTLSYLARSQFGSQHTNIEIYTIDGQRVDSLSQLVHHAAYVAVEPPCKFIQAGYENYIIKATRSWEKRLSKITNSEKSPIKDAIKNVASKSQLNVNFQNNQSRVQNNRIKVSRMITSNDNKTNRIKPYTVDAKQTQDYDNTHKYYKPAKQIEIKKTSISPQITALKQANAPFKVTAFKRVPIKTKDSLCKKPLNIKKTFPGNTKGKVIISGTSDKNIVPSSTITSLNVIETKLKNVVQSKNTTPTRVNHQTSNNNKGDITTKENQVISNIYNDSENGFISNREINDKSNESINKTLETEALSTNGDRTSITFIENNCINKSFISNPGHDDQKEISPYNEINSSFQNPQVLSTEKQKSDSTDPCCCVSLKQLDHFVAISNNDKIIKLQINLEVTNCNVAVSTEQRNTDDKSQLFKKRTKEEKEIQVDLDIQPSEAVQCSSNSIQHKAKEPISAGEIVRNIINDESKIIIIHCSCCDCTDLHYLLKSQSHIECGPYSEKFTRDLVPVIKEDKARCECKNFLLKTECPEDLPSNEPIFSEFEHSVEKPLTITSVHKLTSRYSECTCTSTVNHEQLEARYHEDGRYTFHLPTLHKIKKYGL
ncbi:unnamed protein product [Parnassius mnemosyne]|uniref:Doublecortin domain-containing protein n=1 Tax=Parnassius mnemosyne TaxID=213953 RepID=A0AAV1LXG6_9NEOP